MRKIVCVFSIMVSLIILLTACQGRLSEKDETKEQKQESVTFPEEIFDNIVKIETGKVYPLQEIKDETVIQNICSVLKELELTPVEDTAIDGGDIMKFVYEDGTEKIFGFTSRYILYDDVMYCMEDNQGERLYDAIEAY